MCKLAQACRNRCHHNHAMGAQVSTTQAERPPRHTSSPRASNQAPHGTETGLSLVREWISKDAGGDTAVAPGYGFESSGARHDRTNFPIDSEFYMTFLGPLTFIKPDGSPIAVIAPSGPTIIGVASTISTHAASSGAAASLPGRPVGSPTGRVSCGLGSMGETGRVAMVLRTQWYRQKRSAV